MNKYLLLRNNKQTGPYTLDDIKTMGLKPYDLVWVEGKSAAWRYPGEIEEFKSFAPPVEEQPYDRFFKKSSPEKKTGHLQVEPSVSEDKPSVEKEYIPKIFSGEPKKEPRRRKYVSVSMPSGTQRTTIPADNKEQKENINKTTREEIADKRPVPVSSEEKNSAENTGEIKKSEKPVEQTGSVRWKTIEQQKSVVIGEKSFEQPVSDIREENKTISALFPERKIDERNDQDNNNTFAQAAGLKRKELARSILQGIAIAAALVSLVAVGILIGMGIGSAKSPDAQPTSQTVNSDLAVMKEAPAALDTIMPTAVYSVVDTIAKTTAPPPTNKPKASVKKAVVSPQNLAVEVVAAPETIVKTPEVITDKVADREAIRQNITKQIHISTNDYKVGMFGGIDDVKVTVHNGSEYPVDLVVVDVSYIQSNKKSYKTESLQFKDLAANSSLTLSAPKTNKGIKIQTSLTHVASKSAGISE